MSGDIYHSAEGVLRILLKPGTVIRKSAMPSTGAG